jgi:hypothetical protein
MCDCEELDYDEFVLVLKGIEDLALSSRGALAEVPISGAPTEPVHMIYATKRRK